MIAPLTKGSCEGMEEGVAAETGYGYASENVAWYFSPIRFEENWQQTEEE